jgi:hypothetical protein
MINYVTECKTDKTIIQKIEWSSGRITEIEKKYIVGTKCLHPTKKKALNFIKSMNDKSISYVLAGTYETTNQKIKIMRILTICYYS